MHERDRSIEAQAILKSILESPWVGEQIREGTKIKTLFDECMGILHEYAKVEAPVNTPQNAPGQHLSDEKVAQHLPPPSSYATPQMDNLKMISGSVEATSNKEYKPGKYMYGIKLLGEWHTSFWKSHFDAASGAKQSGHQVKLLYEEKPYKGKMSRTVQSVELA